MKNLTPKKFNPHICFRCQSHEVKVRHYSETMDFKGLTLDVEGLAETICGNCDYRWFTAGQEKDNLDRIKAAFSRKRDAVREEEGLLSGEQIQFILRELNIDRTQAANLFGGGPNAFSKYISGDVLQSHAMDRLLRLTLGVGDIALKYLAMGEKAPLAKNSAGFFVAAVPTFVEGTEIAFLEEPPKPVTGRYVVSISSGVTA